MGVSRPGVETQYWPKHRVFSRTKAGNTPLVITYRIT
jgi:hypothetical protein